MLEWKFIELGDSYGFGITDEGFEFVDISVQGWNDDENFTDLTDLIILRAVNYEDEIKVFQEYCDPDIKNNATAIKIAREAIDDLIKQLD